MVDRELSIPPFVSVLERLTNTVPAAMFILHPKSKAIAAPPRAGRFSA
jgi:hypothetical protein